MTSRPTRQPSSHVDADRDDRLDLALDQRPGQAVLGDAEHHHPAEPLLGLVDGDRMTGEAQIVGGGQPTRAAADDADRRAPVGGHGAVAACHSAAPPKLSTPKRSGHEALQRPDRRPGASILPRRHAVSHGAAHTRPQIDGNGFGARAIRYASAKRPSAMAVT